MDRAALAVVEAVLAVEGGGCGGKEGCGSSGGCECCGRGGGGGRIGMLERVEPIEEGLERHFGRLGLRRMGDVRQLRFAFWRGRLMGLGKDVLASPRHGSKWMMMMMDLLSILDRLNL